MPDYSERIPAAIAKGKEGARIHTRTTCASYDDSCVGCVQNAAVGPLAPVLAEALHKTYRALNAESGEEHWPDALIDFVEKIERLS